MIIYLCDTHTVDDVVASWGGSEPFTTTSTRARVRGGCDACGQAATRNVRLVWVTK